MNKIHQKLILSTVLLASSSAVFAADTNVFAADTNNTNNMFGVWGSVTLKGDFKALSPKLDKFNWQIMNQARTRDDSAKGSRFSENLLFSQINYQLNEHASVGLGYVHDWISHLNKPIVNENRAYQDFFWKQQVGDFKLMSRTRMDERFTKNASGYRARQLVKLSHPIAMVDGLSFYVGDEILFYLTKSTFGKQGFSENRIISGLNYQINNKMGVGLGYLGQYVDTLSGSNLFTHNIQANISYKF